jgi:hypothetical protein
MQAGHMRRLHKRCAHSVGAVHDAPAKLQLKLFAIYGPQSFAPSDKYALLLGSIALHHNGFAQMWSGREMQCHVSGAATLRGRYGADFSVNYVAFGRCA